MPNVEAGDKPLRDTKGGVWSRICQPVSPGVPRASWVTVSATERLTQATHLPTGARRQS